MSNPRVMNSIPLEALTFEDCKSQLKKYIHNQQQQKEDGYWSAIALQKTDTLIGMCAYLKNEEDQHAIAYRFRELYWGKGYGTEIAEGMINFAFSKLGMDYITGDAWIKNVGSMRILEKFMHFVKEFPNPKDQLIDRRFMITRQAWAERMRFTELKTTNHE